MKGHAQDLKAREQQREESLWAPCSFLGSPPRGTHFLCPGLSAPGREKSFNKLLQMVCWGASEHNAVQWMGL